MTTTTPPVLSLPDAERLAKRTLAAIVIQTWGGGAPRTLDADRERVASDLAGLRRHNQHSDVGLAPGDWCPCGEDEPCPDARRYSDGLVRTAALYGVTVD